MAVSYKKLWKLLIDRDMKKKDLCEAAGISHASVAKLGKNENVTTDVLVKICTALKCDISDIMEIIESKEIKDYLGQCISKFIASADHNVWSFHRITSWRNQCCRSNLLLSGSWKPCSAGAVKG